MSVLEIVAPNDLEIAMPYAQMVLISSDNRVVCNSLFPLPFYKYGSLMLFLWTLSVALALRTLSRFHVLMKNPYALLTDALCFRGILRRGVL